MAEQEKAQASEQGGEVDEDQREAAIAVGDHAVAPWQAADDDERERDQPDRAIGQDRIGRRAPSGAGAVDEPQAHRVAADRRGQRLIEERADHVVAKRLQICQRRVAKNGNLAPAQRAEQDLEDRDEHRQADPQQT